MVKIKERRGVFLYVFMDAPSIFEKFSVKIRLFLRLLRVEEKIAFIIAVGVSTLNIAFYTQSFSLRGTLFYMARYFTFGYPFLGIFIVFTYVFYFLQFYVDLTLLFINRFLYGAAFPKGSIKKLALRIALPLRIAAPFILTSLPLYTLLANLNYQLRFSGEDLLFFKSDQFLFGYTPFVKIVSVFHSPFFSALFGNAYFSLGLVMSGMFAFLFLFSSPYSLFTKWIKNTRNNILFREALLSFIISLLIAFPLFYTFPCQDPNNYFIRNIRNNAFSQDVKNALANYHPSQETKNIIARIADAETQPLADKSVPISCFPSMHAIWSFFVVYFLFALTPWSLILTIPWALFLLAGGIYFAQHYVIDYFAAIPVAIISIVIAKTLLRFEQSSSLRLKQSSPR